jgi:tRNA-dihydrouridine synthase B
MSFVSPFYLDDLELSNNVFYAPLAGCSDLPYRLMALNQDFRPGMLFCEMVKMDALVRYDLKTFRLLDFTPDLHPIGAQLCGSNLSMAKDSARIIEDLGFDLLDLNCGCPVDKVTKDGSGSGMLKQPDLIGEILHAMIAVVDIPVTLKIRAGWDEDRINAKEITKIAEEAGAKIITIHGRTRKQAYKGQANWDYIKECKEIAKSIYVFGNGDLFTPEDAKSMFEQTACDGLVVARGTMGRPSFTSDTEKLIIGKQEPGPIDLKKTLLNHLSLIERYQEGKKAAVDLRRIGCWYLKDNVKFKEFRREISRVNDLQKAANLIHSFF